MVFFEPIFIDSYLENKKSGETHFSSELTNLKFITQKYSTAIYSEQKESKEYLITGYVILSIEYWLR